MLLTLALAALAQPAEALPVHRVRFYETGVAWFERRGMVPGTAATLPIPTSHLDDALKSLVVLEGDGLDAVTFAAAEAPDAARVGAGLPGDAPLDFAATVRALVGETVVVERPEGDLRGQLLDVEGPLPRAPAEAGDARPLPDAFALVLLGADGAVRRHVTVGDTPVRPVDPAVAARLAQAASTGRAGRAARPKGLGLQLARRGALALGYVAEAPVWRVAYRLHEGDDGHARLAGWALVHNTTDEDWADVRVELANGEPDSFLYPLAAPRYADRELRVPDRPLATVAQLAQQTVDDMWQVGRGESLSVGHGGIGATGYGMGGGGSAMGAIGHGAVGSVQRGKAPPPIETPSQFVYVVERPVDLPARHSALVPMLRGDVHAEAVVAFPSSGGGARTAVWLVNDTEQTLPEGVLTVVRQGGLEGEAQLERLKPTETQLVTLGRERDVVLTRGHEPLPAREEGLRYDRGQVRIDTVTGTRHTLALHNRSGRERAVWVGLSIVGDVADEALRTELDRHTGDTWVALDVPHGLHDEAVAVTTRTTRSHDPDTLPADQWTTWREAALADDAVLGRAAELASDRERIDHRLDETRRSIEQVTAQLAGLRTSMQAAGDDAGPLVRQASAAEKELRRLGERRDGLEAEREAARQALRDHLVAAWPDARTASR